MDLDTFQTMIILCFLYFQSWALVCSSVFMNHSSLFVNWGLGCSQHSNSYWGEGFMNHMISTAPFMTTTFSWSLLCAQEQHHARTYLGPFSVKVKQDPLQFRGSMKHAVVCTNHVCLLCTKSHIVCNLGLVCLPCTVLFHSF